IKDTIKMSMVHDTKDSLFVSKCSWKLTWPLAIGMLVPGFGSTLPLGYGLGVLNSPQKVIRVWINETLQINHGILLSDSHEVIVWAVIVSIFLIGAVISASFGALVADRLGRRNAFLVNHLFSLSASFIFVFFKYVGSVEILLFSRFLLGLTSGLASSLVPMYLSEIAPQPLKGSINVLVMVFLTSGLILSMVSGLDDLLGNTDLWHYHVGLFGIPVVISLLLHAFLQESPTYCFYISKDR
ncbi:unnamed protein product, partial [Meganyctiphanes norvegica]